MRTNGTPNESAAIASSHRQKKTWLTIVTVLAALVVFGTITALTMPASTMSVSDIATPETAAAETTEGPETPAAAAVNTAAEETPVLPATPETAQGIAVEQAAAEAAALPKSAQIPEGYTVQRTVRDEENGFAVTVYAPEGVIPEDATLSATLLTEDEEEYQKAEQALADQNLLPAEGAESDEAGVAALSAEGDEAGETDVAQSTSYGFAALDIHFEDADGNEVEPNGDVFVTIDAIGLLPEDADPASVTVQHHAEQPATDAETDGENAEPAVTVETVADAADETEGVVEVTPAEEAETNGISTLPAPEGAPATEVQVAFTVDGFSIFTITWHGDWDIRLPVYCVDENGTEIGGGLASLNVPGNNNSLSINANNAPKIDGYQFEKAVVADDTDGIATGNNVSRVRAREDQRDWYWQYRSTSNGKWNTQNHHREIHRTAEHQRF